MMKTARKPINWAMVEYQRKNRTAAEWKELPTVTCACTQVFYQEWEGQTECRDCLSCAATEMELVNPYVKAR